MQCSVNHCDVTLHKACSEETDGCCPRHVSCLKPSFRSNISFHFIDSLSVFTFFILLSVVRIYNWVVLSSGQTATCFVDLMQTLKVVVLVGAVMEDTCYSYLYFLKFSGLVQKRYCQANYISVFTENWQWPFFRSAISWHTRGSYFFLEQAGPICAFDWYFFCSYISAR